MKFTKWYFNYKIAPLDGSDLNWYNKPAAKLVFKKLSVAILSFSRSDLALICWLCRNAFLNIN